MKWNLITSPGQLDLIDENSKNSTILILKHSTRCSISAAALGRLERQWKDEAPLVPYFLDLLKHRDISDQIASRYGVTHKSPQVLVIRNGKCVFSQSHMDISFQEILDHAA
jgi:bacillithiol system protein YtxJ